MDNLKRVKEALEMYASPDYWYGVACQYEETSGTSMLPTADFGSYAKEALTELIEFMDRLDSEELVEEAGYKILELGSGDPYLANENELREVREIAQAAIKTIKGEGDE